MENLSYWIHISELALKERIRDSHAYGIHKNGKIYSILRGDAGSFFNEMIE